MTDPIIIVGGGHGGTQAAASLRQEGFEGKIVIISDEAVLPYHRPPLSKTFLKNSDDGPQLLRPDRFYQENSIDLLLGERVDNIDRFARKVVTELGAHIRYSRLILATGARPRRPAIDGTELDGVFVLRGLSDALRLREASQSVQSAVIVGGGYIGMELAHTLAALGKHVTLLEMAPRVLERSVATAISVHATSYARDSGIDIRTGIAIATIEGERGRAIGVRLADGACVPADLVILGTGVTPNVELAAAAGLEVADGIIVDTSMRTLDPRILAIGDAARFEHWHVGRWVRLESVQNANDQAKHAARTIVGKPSMYREVPWFWSDQGHLKLQTAGLTLDADRQVILGTPSDNGFSVWHFAGPRLLAVDSINRAADHMLARRLLALGINPTKQDMGGGISLLKALVTAATQSASKPAPLN